MGTEHTSGKPTMRRYTAEEKAQAVRLVRQLRTETGQRHGAVKRVAEQLGYGVESVRNWVNQADVDEGTRVGTSTEDAARIKELEQEVKELRRANEILKKAAAFFGAELDRPQKRS
jgi:transposase-like protein